MIFCPARSFFWLVAQQVPLVRILLSKKRLIRRVPNLIMIILQAYLSMLTLLPTWSNLTELPSEVSWTADGSWTMVPSPWIQVPSFIICNKAFACGKLMSMTTVQEHTQMPFGTVSLGIRLFHTSKVSLFSVLIFKDHFSTSTYFCSPLIHLSMASWSIPTLCRQHCHSVKRGTKGPMERHPINRKVPPYHFRIRIIWPFNDLQSGMHCS